jgi:hypothetical protein
LDSDDFESTDKGAEDTMVDATTDAEQPPQDIAAAHACVVSLHALAGIQTENTMIMHVVLKGTCFLALLDTGSTHNFPQGAAMICLSLTPLGGEQLRVTMANGDCLRCAGIARHVPISIVGYEYTITYVGIDLGCFDFIPSVDFLRTLGDIMWNLETMTIAFQRGACRVVWHDV